MPTASGRDQNYPRGPRYCGQRSPECCPALGMDSQSWGALGSDAPASCRGLITRALPCDRCGERGWGLVILLPSQTARVKSISSLLLIVKREKYQTASTDCVLTVVASAPVNDVIARRCQLALVSSLFLLPRYNREGWSGVGGNELASPVVPRGLPNMQSE